MPLPRFTPTEADLGDHFEAVTKSDSAVDNWYNRPRGIWVGGSGNIIAVNADGTSVTFPSVPAHTFLRIRPLRIAVASTATNMIAIW